MVVVEEEEEEEDRNICNQGESEEDLLVKETRRAEAISRTCSMHRAPGMCIMLILCATDIRYIYVTYVRATSNPTPYTVYSTPYTLHPTPYTLHAYTHHTRHDAALLFERS